MSDSPEFIRRSNNNNNNKKKSVAQEKLSLYRKNILDHVLGCGAGLFWGETGSVNQCGTKDKFYGCKLNLNHRQKPVLLS